MSEDSKKRKDLDTVKKEEHFSDLEEDIHRKKDDKGENGVEQNGTLKAIKYWMGDFQPIKLVKISEQMMTRVLENWSKFRITVLKAVNEEESKILDSMARLRKQVQWMNQVHAGKVPEVTTKCTLKLYQELKKIIEEVENGHFGDNKNKSQEFNLKKMYKQSKLITDKLLDSAKVCFEGIKQEIRKMAAQTRQLVTIQELLTEKTYFRFLKEQKHSLIEILDSETITVHNQGYDMDFGAIAGPALTQINNKVAFMIDANDKYQCFIGLGVCHPEIAKEQFYKGASIGSGAYMIRQENQPTQTLALSHAYQHQGTHKKLKKLKWGFTEGDVICIEMDFKKGRVYFTKAGQEECTHEMKVDMNEGPVAPYVILHTKWDRVSIVNY